MPRRALIAEFAVTGSAEGVKEVLGRSGFSELVEAHSRAEVIGLMRESHFDVVMVSLQDIESTEMVALEREIRKNSDMAVIGTSTSADPTLILRAMRAGIAEFLVQPYSSEELAGAVERLTWRSRSEVQAGELLAVYSGKGGLGTTSLAVNVAQALATTRTNSRVALADLVVTGGDVRLFLNLKQTYDLGDLVAKGDKVDSELLNSLLTPCPGGVWALPTGDNPELDDVFDASTISSIVGLLRAHFGMTVVDCEHHLTDRTLAALDAADRVLLVTHLSIPSLRSTQRTLSICRRLGYDNEKLCVVVNRFQSADVLAPREAEELLQCDIFWRLPNDYQLSAASLNNGVPVVLHEPNSKLARSYIDLARKLSGGNPRQNGAKPADSGASRLRNLFRINRGVKNVT